MNTESAELYLGAYRPGVRGEDGRIEKAAKIAGRKEPLKSKLDEQVKFDGRCAEEIAALDVPEGLAEKLDKAVPDEHTGIHWRGAIKQPAFLAAVIGLLILTAWGVWAGWNRMQSFPGKENAVLLVEINDQMSGMEFEPKAAEIRNLEDWLFSKYGFEHFYVPPSLAAYKTVGCRVFKQDDAPVAQLAVEKNNMICYMFQADDLGVKIEPDDSWRVFVDDEWAAAVQQHEGKCFMIAFRGKRADMNQFIEGLSKHEGQ